MTGPPAGLTRVTVNLIPRAVAVLDEEQERSGQGKTDTINRALQLWGWWQRTVADGGTVQVARADGSLVEVQIF